MGRGREGYLIMIKKVESDAWDLIIYTDGVSRGNPGDAGIGVIPEGQQRQGC